MLNPENTPGEDIDLGDLDLAALLDKVVVTATKSAMREDQALAITTVISREEIQQWGYRSVEEALHHVAGVYVVNDHIIPNLAVRGISGGLRSESGLVKVMIDGQDHERLTTLYDVLKSSIGNQPGERAGDEIPTMAPAGRRTLSSLGANALVIWSALRWLTVTGGARLDYHNVYGSKPSGRLAAVVQLIPPEACTCSGGKRAP